MKTMAMAIITNAGIIYRDHGPSDGMALLMECPPARQIRSGFASPEAARAWAKRWLAEHPLPPLAPPCPCCGAAEGEAHIEMWGRHGWQLRDGCTAARAAARRYPEECARAQTGILAAHAAAVADGVDSLTMPHEQRVAIWRRRDAQIAEALAPLRAAIDATDARAMVATTPRSTAGEAARILADLA